MNYYSQMMYKFPIINSHSSLVKYFATYLPAKMVDLLARKIQISSSKTNILHLKNRKSTKQELIYLFTSIGKSVLQVSI